MRDWKKEAEVVVENYLKILQKTPAFAELPEQDIIERLLPLAACDDGIKRIIPVVTIRDAIEEIERLRNGNPTRI